MKTSILSLVSAALLFVVSFGSTQTAKAQGIRFNFGDDFSISIGGGNNNGGGNAGNRPGIGTYIDQFGNLVVVGQDRRPRPVNPVIDDQESGSFDIDSNTGNWELKRQRDTIHASALDRNRNVVDPGSMMSKSSIARDAQGNQIETTVTSWTSFGVPHSNTTTRRIQQGNNGRVIDERNVMRSTNPMAEQRPARQAAPQNDDGIPGFDE